MNLLIRERLANVTAVWDDSDWVILISETSPPLREALRIIEYTPWYCQGIPKERRLLPVTVGPIGGLRHAVKRQDGLTWLSTNRTVIHIFRKICPDNIGYAAALRNTKERRLLQLLKREGVNIEKPGEAYSESLRRDDLGEGIVHE